MKWRTEVARRAAILLVEDDPADQELARRALTGDVLDTDLRIVSDGSEAMDYLYRQGSYADPASSPRPDLILLDLNMPRMDGRQVLARVRHDPDLRRIPVVVLTTSSDEDDVSRSYDLGCNSYITKPLEMDGFHDCMRGLGAYWFRLAKLPSG